MGLIRTGAKAAGRYTIRLYGGRAGGYVAGARARRVLTGTSRRSSGTLGR